MADYKCKDAKLAAFLSHLGIPLMRIDCDPNGWIKFTFDDRLSECEAITRNYFSGAGTSDAQRLLDDYRNLWYTIRTARQHGYWENKEPSL